MAQMRNDDADAWRHIALMRYGDDRHRAVVGRPCNHPHAVFCTPWRARDLGL
jgi:hypothetical protein